MKKILLDENIPRRLGPLVTADFNTVQRRGWSGKLNGDLLASAAAEFDVLNTMDRGIEFQQRLKGLNLCVIGLIAASNRLEDLLPLVDEIRAELDRCRPGHFIRIGER